MTSPIVRHRHGSVAELHALEIPVVAQREVWVMHPTDRAVVLGSSQAETDIDPVAADARGLSVVRRRSGGGAVLVDESSVWVDVLVPSDDAHWTADVSRSFEWLGDACQRLAASYGVEATVHRGAYERTDASAQVCFAGAGPGEVFAGSRKLIGLSQRRTRHGARFQVAVLLWWDPTAWADLLTDERAAVRDRIPGAAVGFHELVSSPPTNGRLVDDLVELIATA